jgi:hypothetical protein
LPERFFLIKQAEPGRDREIISINGQLNPDVLIQPGELQFWRIANVGATLLIKLKIDGMSLYVLAPIRPSSWQRSCPVDQAR